jgi:hypothetical protein
MFKAVGKLGLEGIVSKKLDAPYRSGPSKTWSRSKIRRHRLQRGRLMEFLDKIFSLIGGIYCSWHRPKPLLSIGITRLPSVCPQRIARNRTGARKEPAVCGNPAALSPKQPVPSTERSSC